jgi:AraC-like DNA-binding protein
VATALTARHLLRAKDLADARYFEPLAVADLAAAAGLSPAHFSRRFTASFHRMFGLAPLAYRAAYPPAERHLRIPRCVALAYGRPGGPAR